MLRANYITYDDESKRIFAEYDKGTDPAELAGVASQLARTGIGCGVTATVSGNPVVWLGFVDRPTDTEEIATVRRLKELTNPRLPISVIMADLTLMECPCRNHNSASIWLTFLPGMEPSDKQQFLYNFYAKVGDIPIRKLLPENRQTQPPTLLYEAFGSLLKGLGAYMPTMNILLEKKACTEPAGSQLN